MGKNDMRHFLFSIALILFINLWFPVWGLEPFAGYVMCSWNTDEGLEDAYSFTVSPGPDGRIWVTHGEVPNASYIDRYGVGTIPSPGQMALIQVSQDGQLWAKSPLTEDGNAVYKRFIDGVWEPFKVEKSDTGGVKLTYFPLSNKQAIHIYNGSLYGITVENQTNQLIKSASNTQIGALNQFFPASDNSVWVSGETGVARLSFTVAEDFPAIGWKIYPINSNRYIESDTRQPFPVVDVGGIPYVSAYDFEKKRSVLLTWADEMWSEIETDDDQSIRSGWSDQHGGIWRIFRHLKYDEVMIANPNYSPNPLRIEPYTKLSVQPDGVFWISSKYGVRRFAPAVWRPTSEEKINSSNSKIDNIVVQKYQKIGRMIRDYRYKEDGKKWILSYDQKTEKYFSIDLYDGEFIQTVHTFNENEPWLGHDFIVRNNGEVWTAGWGDESRPGLIAYIDGEYRTFDESDGLPEQIWLSLIEPGDGTLWVGGRNSIFSWDGKSFTLVKTGFNKVRGMVKTSDGSVWASSENGVFCFRNGNWIQWTEKDGLPTNMINDIVKNDKEQIWVETSLGECVYEPDADRLPPDTLFDVKRNIKEVPPGGATRFNFSGVDQWRMTETNRLYYSYRVDGGEWSAYSTDSIATIPGLKPGHHSFEVKAIDRNWNEDTTPVVWNFTVLQYWYLEPMFLLTSTIGSLFTLLFAFLAARRHVQLASSNKHLNKAMNDINTMNAELQEKNAELLELDKMKSSFVSQASHDLRTPLTSIKSSLDNLVRGVGGGLNERQNQVIRRALGSVNRLTALINDVLDINRIESGRMVLEKSQFQLESIVKNVIEENQPFANQKKIKINASGLDNTYPLEADAGKIERVIGELVNNAIKYTPESGKIDVALTLDESPSPPSAAANSPRGRGCIVFSVKDNGIGMTKEDCEKIFERFYRVDSAKMKAKGSGLGLSIAKELVEMHGGEIEVDSHLENGTMFILKPPDVESGGTFVSESKNLMQLCYANYAKR